ncbi:MAG: glycosyltransferase family 4 protein [Balneolaceae bacterium]
MRILYISHLHPPTDQPLKNIGGMQNVSMQLVEAMRRRKDIHVKEIILNSSWKYIGIKTFFFLLTLLWKIPASVKSFNPDVILFSSMVTSSVLPFMIRKPAPPCITINHGQDVTLPFAPYQWYLRSVFKNLQGVISVSTATRQACIERGMAQSKGVALPNGFDVDSEKLLPVQKEARKLIEQQFDVNLSSSKLLLTVGRQVKRKGHQWFIEEVMGNIKTDVTYLMVGDGPENENIEYAREQSPLKDHIIIAGRQPEEILNAAYAAADLFVMPNIPVKGDMEGFGIVLLEANRAGVPAVAADLEGIKDVIEQGVNGYRIPHGEAEKFANKIDDVLNNELEKLSESAKEYVNANFSWNSVADKYITYLKSRVTGFH